MDNDLMKVTLEAAGALIPLLATVAAGVFGVMATKASRRKGILKREDKIALYGVIVSSVIATTGMVIDLAGKYYSAEEERRRLDEELIRQSKILRDIQRGLYGVAEYRVDVEYTLDARHPSLAGLVKKWDAHLTSGAIAGYDLLGYSPDKTNFVSRERTPNSEPRITALAINEGSDLFPRQGTAEYRVLTPILYLLVLRKDVPDAASMAEQLEQFGAEKKLADLALFAPANLAARENIDLRFSYEVRDPAQKHVKVSLGIRGATATWNTGAVISLLDLPGREIALLGLNRDSVQAKAEITDQAGKSGRVSSPCRAKQLRVRSAC